MTSTTSPSSEKIRPQLRPIRSSDAEALCAIFNMPGFRWGTFRMPFERVEQVERRIAKSGQETTWIVAEVDGKIVGHGSLIVQGSPRRSHIGEINIGLHDAFVGKGIGSAILGALLHVADNWRALKRVELTVYADNEPAIRLYTSHGFEIEGRHVKAGFTDGRYHDLLSMARLRF
ncbi:GNAT family N-acetyltransferase [Mesorhizobium sp. ESP-6-4]|uniref:GNAT family N-acetyltransferase n=1 Tax=Mesorhizobium sp. ESP-6-4 TaxID=2876624 RepID=UPI001CCFE1BE|nr:GNAT family N-acetyltransferase [Mesorhizobium sp. ESP-6-4]MBZ9661833.1 GNAT family N-acetyltransferase [Mesorhizobium sp. ESP-6-4]